jgi:hypothetical protein
MLSPRAAVMEPKSRIRLAGHSWTRPICMVCRFPDVLYSQELASTRQFLTCGAQAPNVTGIETETSRGKQQWACSRGGVSLP